MKLVPIITRLDIDQPKAAIGELSRGLDALNSRAMRQFQNFGGGTASIDTKQMESFIRLSKTAQIEVANAQQTARQVTQSKQAELRQFENAEKSKQRIAEISARGQIQAQAAVTRAAESEKRREFQQFERIERQKAQLAVAKESKYGAGDIAGLVGTAISGSTAVAGVYAVLKLGAEYEQAMNLFQATTKATAAEMEAAGKKAVDLGNDLTLPSVSAATAASAMVELGKNGMTAQQSMDAVRGTLLLAAAAGIDAAQAAEINSNALNTFNLKASESSRVADLLAATANASSAEITDIAQSLSQAGAVAANANIPIEAMVALIGELANRGIKGSDAGTSLKTMIQRLQSPTNESAAALEKLNVKIYDQSGAMNSMQNIIGQFEASLSGLSQEQRDQAMNTIFGSDAVRAATIIVGQGAKGFDEMSAAVNRSNAAQELAEARTKGLGGAWENLKSQAETVGLTIYGKIAPALTAVTLAAASLIGLIGKSPAAFALAAGAVGLFIVALNASSLASFSLGITQIVSSVVLLGKVMIGTASLVEGTLATTVAFATGWGAVAIALGAVIYVISNMNSAIEEANNLSLDSINANAESLQSYKAISTEIGNLTAASNQVSQAQIQNGDIHERLNAILGRLDPATQIYIKSLGDEKSQIKALTGEIDQNIEARKSALEAQIRTAAAGVIAQRNLRDEQNAYIKDLQGNINETQALMNKPLSELTGRQLELVNEGRTRIQLWSQSIVAADGKVSEFNKSLGENEIKVIQAAKGLGYNTDQLRQFLTAAGYSADQVNVLTLAYQNATNASNQTGNSQDSLSGKLNNTADATAGVTKEVFNLRNELAKLTNFKQEEVDRSVYDIVSLTKTKAEATALARKTLANSPDFRQKIKDNRDTEDRMKAVQEIYSPSEKSSSNRIKAAKKELSELKQQIESAMANPQVKAFFSALSTIEGGGRFTVVGGSKANINDPRHPGQYGMGMKGPAGWSTAAGFWQETQSNWKRLAPILNLNDFRDVNQQLKVALYLFQEAAGKKGINGIAELLKGNFEKAAKAGTQPWAASPFSTLPGGKRKDFLSLVNQNLGSGNTLDNGNAEVTNAERIVELRQQIANLQANGLTDAKLQQDIQLANFELELRETSEILKLRQKLNYEITEPLPQSAEDRKEALRVLQEFDRRKDTINQTIRDITDKLQKQNVSGSFAFVAPINPEEAKQQAEQFDLVSKSLDNFTQMGETARQQIAELSSEFDEGLSPLQKFDLQVKMLRESGKLTADQLDILNLIIPQTRDELEKAGTMELGKKLRLNAKAVTTSLTDMVNNFRQQITELNQSEDVKPFGGFLQQIEQLKELDLPTESFAEMRDAISPAGIDVEKLAGIARAWLEISAAIGGTDPAKIDEIVDKIKQTAQAFNQLTDEQRKAKNAEDYKNLNESLDDEYAQLIRNGRELTTYEQTLRDLNTTYKNLSDSEKANLLLKAEQIDAYRQSQEVFNKTTDYIEDKLHTIKESGFKGLFKSLLQDLEDFLLKASAKMLASKFLQLLQGKGLNVGASQTGGNWFSKILGSVFGGGQSSGVNLGNAGQIFSGNQGNGVYNFGGTAETFTGSGVSPISIAKQVLGGAGDPHEALHTASASSGNILSSFGKYLPFAGIAVGLLSSLFGGSAKRREDAKQNLPKLQESFGDALNQMRDLVTQIQNVTLGNALNFNASEITSKAAELRANIASGFQIEFKSKKYRKIAQQQIQAKLAEFDGLNSQLQIALTAANLKKEQASAADERAGRLLPEFATGAYIDPAFLKQYGDFKRRNGMLGGAFTGRDTLPSMLARGEMVLNPTQINAVINAAGGVDVFRPAQIPGYATGTYVAPTAPSFAPASGGTSANNATNITLSIPVTVNAETADEKIVEVILDALSSDQMRKEVVKAYEKGKSRKIK